MKWFNKLRNRSHGDGRGFLTRLARDRAGNTLAMMAAALVPLIGFSGSAVDMARLYVVKARLQQACDAGVLAGRKAMTTNGDTAMPSGQQQVAMTGATATQAQTFFNNNFRSGWFQNANSSFTPYKAITGTTTAANAAYATATADVPMALMRFFGAPTVTLNVSCQAIYDLADADIMFVLDTTGSMSCYPTDSTNCATSPATYTRADGTTGYRDPEKSPTTSNGQPLYSKIESLRRAVVTFDTTMRTNADPTTHFRYGFVTYSSAVNVGAALSGVSNGAYIQNGSWTYQSRHQSPVVGPGGVLAGEYAYGNTFTQTINVPQSYCPTGGSARMPATGFQRTYNGLWNDEGYAEARLYTNISYSNGNCSGTGQRMRPYWRYEPVSWSLASYVATLGTANGVANPTRFDGPATNPWRGCVEELNTTHSASFDVNNLPDDLNPDVKPTSATDKWRPIWSEVEWLRNTYGASDIKDDQVAEDSGNSYYGLNYGPGHLLDSTGSAACGMPAQRLQVMTAQQVHDYVYNTDFQPFGGTYHDVGMIWGTRMLSPTSVFADSVAWPGRNDPTRTIVFMTDGTMSPSEMSYGQYGVEMLDNRVGSNGNSNTQYNLHVARFRVECDAAKKKGFTIYTVAVGLHGAAVPDLDYCSSQGQTYYADDSQTLTSVFTTIAQRVAKLRISK